MKFIVRRIVLPMAVTLLIVSALVFLLTELLPGDPAEAVAGEFATPAAVEELRGELRLEDPVLVRYGRFVVEALQGDLGESVKVRQGASVTGLIWEAIPVTASLLIVTIIGSVLVALPAGYLAARRPDSLMDRIVTSAATVAMALPPFVLALILITVFALQRQWFPAIGYSPLSEGVGGWMRGLVLPAFAIGAVSVAELTRQVRGAFVEVFETDHIRTSVAKGLGRGSVVWKHALKNISSPVVTLTGLQVTRLIGGAVVVELIFVMPGFGSLALQAVTGRDILLLRGVVLVGAVATVVVNMIVDMIVLALNPKARAA